MSVSKYTLEKCIGKGSFGDVYKATTRDNQVVAVKILCLDESADEFESILQEIQFLSKLQSPYITRYFETLQTDMSIWIVMEYCGGGSCLDLLKYYKKFNEGVVSFVVREVLKGLKYLHGDNKVHRDIKSANILLTTEGEVKLGDFGVSGEITFTQAKRHTFVGTPYWMAPEVISKHKVGYNSKADIWSLGITTIELVTGQPPYCQQDPMDALFDIPKRRPPLLEGTMYSDNLKNFIKYCLRMNEDERPKASTLLHHSFISQSRKPQNVELKQMITNHQAWLAKRRGGGQRTPRHEVSPRLAANRLIEWDFNNTPLLQFNGNRIIPRYTPEERHQIELLEDGLSFNDSPPEKYSLLREILIYCMRRVYHRARSPHTKFAVNRMMNELIEHEQTNPGIVEALMEELYNFRDYQAYSAIEVQAH